MALAGGGGDPLAPMWKANLAVPADPLELSIELGWYPAYAGDPLSVHVGLQAAQYQQARVAQWLGLTNANGRLSDLPALGSIWPSGVQLELALLKAGGIREVVLSSNRWTAFRRPTTNEGWGSLLLPVAAAEWLVPATNVGLSAGVYELTAFWDGQGLTDTNLIPAAKRIAAEPLLFAVTDPTNQTMQADHLGRLAIAARAAGELPAARTLAGQAIQLDGGNASIERTSTLRLAANLALAAGDYFDAFHTLGLLARTSNSRDRVYDAVRDQDALRPVTTLVRPPPGQPWKLEVAGWPSQLIEVQRSADLATWTTVQTLPVGPEGSLDVATVSTNDPPHQFYRALWRP
jgi:hypothetical protein